MSFSYSQHPQQNLQNQQSLIPQRLNTSHYIESINSHDKISNDGDNQKQVDLFLPTWQKRSADASYIMEQSLHQSPFQYIELQRMYNKLLSQYKEKCLKVSQLEEELLMQKKSNELIMQQNEQLLFHFTQNAINIKDKEDEDFALKELKQKLEKQKMLLLREHQMNRQLMKIVEDCLLRIQEGFQFKKKISGLNIITQQAFIEQSQMIGNIRQILGFVHRQMRQNAVQIQQQQFGHFLKRSSVAEEEYKAQDYDYNFNNFNGKQLELTALKDNQYTNQYQSSSKGSQLESGIGNKYFSELLGRITERSREELTESWNTSHKGSKRNSQFQSFRSSYVESVPNQKSELGFGSQFQDIKGDYKWQQYGRGSQFIESKHSCIISEGMHKSTISSKQSNEQLVQTLFSIQKKFRELQESSRQDWLRSKKQRQLLGNQLSQLEKINETLRDEITQLETLVKSKNQIINNLLREVQNLKKQREVISRLRSQEIITQKDKLQQNISIKDQPKTDLKESRPKSNKISDSRQSRDLSTLEEFKNQNNQLKYTILQLQTEIESQKLEFQSILKQLQLERQVNRLQRSQIIQKDSLSSRELQEIQAENKRLTEQNKKINQKLTEYLETSLTMENKDKQTVKLWIAKAENWKKISVENQNQIKKLTAQSNTIKQANKKLTTQCILLKNQVHLSQQELDQIRKQTAAQARQYKVEIQSHKTKISQLEMISKSYINKSKSQQKQIHQNQSSQQFLEVNALQEKINAQNEKSKNTSQNKGLISNANWEESVKQYSLIINDKNMAIQQLNASIAELHKKNTEYKQKLVQVEGQLEEYKLITYQQEQLIHQIQQANKDILQQSQRQKEKEAQTQKSHNQKIQQVKISNQKYYEEIIQKLQKKLSSYEQQLQKLKTIKNQLQAQIFNKDCALEKQMTQKQIIYIQLEELKIQKRQEINPANQISYQKNKNFQSKIKVKQQNHIEQTQPKQKKITQISKQTETLMIELATVSREYNLQKEKVAILQRELNQARSHLTESSIQYEKESHNNKYSFERISREKNQYQTKIKVLEKSLQKLNLSIKDLNQQNQSMNENFKQKIQTETLLLNRNKQLEANLEHKKTEISQLLYTIQNAKLQFQRNQDRTLRSYKTQIQNLKENSVREIIEKQKKIKQFYENQLKMMKESFQAYLQQKDSQISTLSQAYHSLRQLYQTQQVNYQKQTDHIKRNHSDYIVKISEEHNQKILHLKESNKQLKATLIDQQNKVKTLQFNLQQFTNLLNQKNIAIQQINTKIQQKEIILEELLKNQKKIEEIQKTEENFKILEDQLLKTIKNLQEELATTQQKNHNIELTLMKTIATFKNQNETLKQQNEKLTFSLQKFTKLNTEKYKFTSLQPKKTKLKLDMLTITQKVLPHSNPANVQKRPAYISYLQNHSVFNKPQILSLQRKSHQSQKQFLYLPIKPQSSELNKLFIKKNQSFEGVEEGLLYKQNRSSKNEQESKNTKFFKYENNTSMRSPSNQRIENSINFDPILTKAHTINYRNESIIKQPETNFFTQRQNSSKENGSQNAQQTLINHVDHPKIPSNRKAYQFKVLRQTLYEQNRPNSKISSEVSPLSSNRNTMENSQIVTQKTTLNKSQSIKEIKPRLSYSRDSKNAINFNRPQSLSKNTDSIKQQQQKKNEEQKQIQSSIKQKRLEREFLLSQINQRQKMYRNS